MLTREENDELTRVGPGTPAGELLRRYWHPIALAHDLTPEQPKMRVRVLGEDLVLVRFADEDEARHQGPGVSGDEARIPIPDPRPPTPAYGLVAEQCLHRGASLYYGFLEDGGIRCPYHGWLYDRAGRCLEQPFEPEQSMLRHTVRLPAYPVEEVRGLLFAYLGPQPAPRIPPWDVIVREDGAHSIRIQPVLAANWLQVQETNLDPTHIIFLHQRLKAIAQGLTWRFLPIEDMEFEPNEWGIVKRRQFGGDTPLKEEAGHPALFPNILWHGGKTISLYWRTPLDDTHTQSFWLGFTPGAPPSLGPDGYPPVTYDTLKKEDGDFHLITPASQDAMAWETQGPIRDRTREHLGASDQGVVMWRQLLKEQIDKVRRGEDPMGVVRDPEVEIIAFSNWQCPDMALRVGIAGYGGAARQVLPAFKHVPDVELAAVADVRYDALQPFRERGIRTFDSAEAMFESPDVDAVWISTPNHLHMDHTIRAATNGKHIIGEKPMALTLDQAQAMIEAVESAGVTYVQGHSQMYNPPVQKMRAVITSGQLGRVFAINNWRYQNWLNKPRLATEVDTATGGGVVYRQGPHHTDIVRCLGGGMVKSVRAITGRWSPDFPNTEGNYSAFLAFTDGTAATMVLSGYARFDSAELVEGAEVADQARRTERITQPLSWEEKYSLPEYADAVDQEERVRGGHDYYGLTVVSCERGDLRDGPRGIYLYDDEGRHELPCDSKGVAHVHELRELQESVAQGRPAFPDARWGRATLEVILAILQSSAEDREITLEHQVPYVDRAI